MMFCFFFLLYIFVLYWKYYLQNEQYPQKHFISFREAKKKILLPGNDFETFSILFFVICSIIRYIRRDNILKLHSYIYYRYTGNSIWMKIYIFWIEVLYKCTITYGNNFTAFVLGMENGYIKMSVTYWKKS